MKPSVFVTMLVVLLAVLGGLTYKIIFPDVVYVQCQACHGTGKKPCSTPECPEGTMPCTNVCLKLGSGHWVSLHVEGHPDSDIWQRFYRPDGGWNGFNQKHVGHLIVLEDGTYVDKGTCPTCHGSGKIACPQCENAPVCAYCHGKGVVPKDN